MLQIGCPRVDRPRVGLSVIPSPRGGMECYDSYGRSGSIRRGDLATGGGHDSDDPRPTAVPGIMRWPGPGIGCVRHGGRRKPIR